MIRTQTIIIGICVIITLLLAISNLFIPTNNEEKQSIITKAKFYLLLIILLVIFPLAIVHLYAVNCMLEGNCEFSGHISRFSALNNRRNRHFNNTIKRLINIES